MGVKRLTLCKGRATYIYIFFFFFFFFSESNSNLVKIMTKVQETEISFKIL